MCHLRSMYGAVVEFGKKEFRVMDKLFPIIVPADVEKSQAVTVPVDTVIPPRSEAIIIGRVDNAIGHGREGMLEPAESVSKHCNVMLARVDCKVEQRTLPVWIINVTDDALTLKEGVKVGVAYGKFGGSRDGGWGGGGGVLCLPWTADTLLVHLGLHQTALIPLVTSPSCPSPFTA